MTLLEAKSLPLVQQIVGIVFFGAPHRGLHIDALDKYAWDCLQQPRAQTLVKELGENSTFLRDLHNSFVNKLRYLPHIISIYETKKSPTLVRDPQTEKWTRRGPLKEAVEKPSAILGFSEEHETAISAEFDHSSIEKLSRSMDGTYELLVHEIKKKFPMQSYSLEAPARSARNSPTYQQLYSQLMPEASTSANEPYDSVFAPEGEVAHEVERGTFIPQKPSQEVKDERRESTRRGSEELMPRQIETWLQSWLQGNTERVLCIQGRSTAKWLRPLTEHIHAELTRAGIFVLGLELRADGLWSIEPEQNSSLRELERTLREEQLTRTLLRESQLGSKENCPPEPLHLVIGCFSEWDTNVVRLPMETSNLLRDITSSPLIRLVMVVSWFPEFLSKWISESQRRSAMYLDQRQSRISNIIFHPGYDCCNPLYRGRSS